MQFGIMDDILQQADELATFRLARELGFAGVECGASRADLRDPEGSRLGRLRAAMDATGLAVPSLALHQHNSGGVGSASGAVSEAARDDIERAVGWAARLGAKVILVPFFFDGDLATPDAVARAATAFRDLCPLAERAGVSLCYEGTLPAAAIRDLAARVGSPAFGCYFDLANVVWLGMETAAEIRGIGGGLIRQVHMKETRVGPGDCRPGEGRVDYPASAAALREVGYDGWVVLETPAGPPQQVAEDLAFTRRSLGG